MKKRINRIPNKFVEIACKGNNWDFSNKVLYDLCSKHPHHKNGTVIAAKILLIGRVYAAAIERRKDIDANDYMGDDFYFKKVVPELFNSDMDSWLHSLRRFRNITSNNISDVLRVHLWVTELFSNISGLNKRSLASKYLHFHLPNLFYIYDSRVVSALSSLSSITGRLGPNRYEADNEYRKVFEKCLVVRGYVKDMYGVSLSPRHLDNLLLEIVESA